MPTRTYRGYIIWRQSSCSPMGGYRLPWIARADDGPPLAADTLAGLKELIARTRQPRVKELI